MNIGKIGANISLLKSFRKLTTPNKSIFALIPFRYLFFIYTLPVLKEKQISPFGKAFLSKEKVSCENYGALPHLPASPERAYV